MQTFYWFDFESFGANPSRDRPAQFAGLRTDMNFNPVDEPLVIYCQPADDFLPAPEACRITGITPQIALQKGVTEREFFRQIHLQLSQPETCATGYNNIRFDDEMIRFGFYRNFYDPYAREWQDGNSRWDIIDLLRMTHALRPVGIHWPQKEDGSPSFRLEQLTKANGIGHSNAHDALSDVEATIAMAKLVRDQQPKLFNYLFALRDKRRAQAEIDVVQHRPFIHVSAMLGPEHHYCGVMMPLTQHPGNRNSFICLDLCKAQVDLSELDAESIQRLIFSSSESLAETGDNRLPIKEVHINKCPAIAPLGVMNLEAQERLGIDLEDCLQTAEYLRTQLPEFIPKLLAAYENHRFEAIHNPDFALYSGGFFDQHDKQLMQQIRRSPPEVLKEPFDFHDPRLPEMLFRYRARNFFDTLSADEQERWHHYRLDVIQSDEPKAGLSVAEFDASLSQLQTADDSDSRQLVRDLQAWKDRILSIPR